MSNKVVVNGKELKGKKAKRFLGRSVVEKKCCANCAKRRNEECVSGSRESMVCINRRYSQWQR